MREFYEFDEQQYQGKGRIWKYITIAVVFTLLGAIGMYYMLPYISDDNSKNAVVTPSEQEKNVAQNNQANQGEDENEVPELGYKGDLFITSDNPVVEIAEKVGPAVVGITNKSIITYRDWFFGDVYMQEQEGYGSGIILSDEGYIVTNAHVVEGAKEIYVVFQGEKQVKAQLVGIDTTSDVAVVKVDPEDLKEVKYAVAKIGDSDKVRPGELAVAIGNPLGHELAGTITVGVISAVNRTLVIDQKPMNLIQTDAAINRGNSGGALVNARGEVIGMNTLKGSGTEGLGFAIPSNEFLPIVKELIKNGTVVREGKRPGLGILGQEITASDARRLNYPQGIYVQAVMQNGAAAKAGIQPGDVIIGIDDKSITTYDELKNILNQHKVGDVVKVKVWRDGKEYVFRVTLQALE